jgi:protein-glutamine gamma-glutamyltransferase
MNPQGRQALAWLLGAQAVSILPRADILPLWSVPAWFVVAFWYWNIARGRLSYPPRWLKILLAAATVAAVYSAFDRLLNLEAMLTILVCASTLKLLELRSRRDHWLLLLLCYFLLASGFLFSQQLDAMLVALLQLLIILTAQQALHRDDQQPLSMLRFSMVLAFQSLPLMLVLFLVFPRIAPLWSMPVPGGNATTGMSDSLEFGDVANLSRSGALAFRVSFDDAPPATANLYWRGIVLESFDGRKWTAAGWRQGRLIEDLPFDSQLDYTVTLEPGYHRWLYTLAVGRMNRDDVRLNSAYVWQPRQPLSGRLSYRVASDLNRQKPERFAEALQHNLYVPADNNPRAQQLAQQWRRYPDPVQRVAAAEEFFRSGDFVYTLNPPQMGRDNVDEFLFGDRRGFCEHFAGSFALLMRSAGIPARVVVGYQGGEFNRDDDYLLVYQSDAHAWVEVWLANTGWQRIDPTSFVAPSRIELGAEGFLRSQGAFLTDSPLSLRRYSWATQLRYFLDSINYAWARWVLNYDSERQWRLLEQLLGNVSALRILLMLLLAGGLPALLLLIKSLWEQRLVCDDEVSSEYLRCCQKLARKGITRHVGETPQAFLARVEQQAPGWSAWFTEVTRCYDRAAYTPVSVEAAREAAADLRKLRRRYKKQTPLTK